MENKIMKFGIISIMSGVDLLIVTNVVANGLLDKLRKRIDTIEFTLRSSEETEEYSYCAIELTADYLEDEIDNLCSVLESLDIVHTK